mmetsp:Transcript_43182/g.134284  ORF Transcript_43182/g.134284 Transcript_43182/m.134284 type:complete len:246 (-) Transcript_43182:280-1017(-)
MTRTRLLPRQEPPMSPQSSIDECSRSGPTGLREMMAGRSCPDASCSASSSAASKSPVAACVPAREPDCLSVVVATSALMPWGSTASMPQSARKIGLGGTGCGGAPRALRPLRLGVLQALPPAATRPALRSQGRSGAAPRRCEVAGRSGVVGCFAARPNASPQLADNARAISLSGPSARPATSAPWRKATAAEAQRPRCSRSAPRLWQATAKRADSSRPGGASESGEACATRRRVASIASLSASSW